MRFLHDKTANKPTDFNITPLSMESTRSDEFVPISATASSATTTFCPTTASHVTTPPSTSATTVSDLSKHKANDAHLIPPVNSRHASKTTSQDAIDLAILKQLEKTDKKIDETTSKENTSDETYLYCQSLIPIIRALPHKKKRKAMIQISQL
ncbi:---NA---, partial [Paramuricea clavata]